MLCNWALSSWYKSIGSQENFKHLLKKSIYSVNFIEEKCVLTEQTMRQGALKWFTEILTDVALSTFEDSLETCPSIEELTAYHVIK